MKPADQTAIPARLWAKVEITDTCWLWLAHKDPHGYGKCRYKGSRWSAHRAFYDALVGPIPERYEVDHLCMVRNCVRPEHLEAVTRTVNRQRQGAAVIFCPRGHEYTPENTYRAPGFPNQRKCRACMPILLAASLARRSA